MSNISNTHLTSRGTEIGCTPMQDLTEVKNSSSRPYVQTGLDPITCNSDDKELTVSIVKLRYQSS